MNIVASPVQIRRATSSLQAALGFIDDKVPKEIRDANAEGIDRARRCLAVAIDEFNNPERIRHLGLALAWAVTLISENYDGPDTGLGDAQTLLQEWVWATSEQRSDRQRHEIESNSG
jgi:hypothetical protein